MFTDPASPAATTPEERSAVAYHLAPSWREQPLEKFSLTRKRLLLDMRAAAGAPPIGRMEAMLGDALRWLWLCSQPGATLERVQSGAGLPLTRDTPLPLRMQLACDRWAEEQAAQAPLDQSALVNLFIESWLASEATATVAPETVGAAPEDDVGESRGL